MRRMLGRLSRRICFVLTILVGFTLAGSAAGAGEECPPPCAPRCQDHGHLTLDPGPIVSVDKPNPNYGETVTFTVVSVHDSEWSKKVCDPNGHPVEQVFPPVPGIRYSWRLITPNGTVTEGVSQSASAHIDRCGTWDVQFFAEPERECKPFGTPSLNLGGLAHGTYIGGSSVSYNGNLPCPPGGPTAADVRALIDGANDACLSSHGVSKQALRTELDRLVGIHGEELLCRCCDEGLGRCGESVASGRLGLCLQKLTLQYLHRDKCPCWGATTIIHEILHQLKGTDQEGPICDVIIPCFSCPTCD